MRKVKEKNYQSEGEELPNGERISLEDEKEYNYLSLLQFVYVKSKDMKNRITKKCYQRIRKILKASLNAGNNIQAINAGAVSIIRYGAGIVELKKMN